MTIDINLNEGNLTLVLNGRLDSTTADELDNVINENITNNIKSLIIDLTYIDFISSKGLRVLVAAYKKLNGNPLIIKGANSSVLEVLRLSGLEKVFSIID